MYPFTVNDSAYGVLMAAVDRKKHALWSLYAWYAMIPVALILSALAAIEAFKAGEPYGATLLVFVTILSVWTGIESGHARKNADDDT